MALVLWQEWLGRGGRMHADSCDAKVEDLKLMGCYDLSGAYIGSFHPRPNHGHDQQSIKYVSKLFL